MSDILTKALKEQDYLMHHGILGQKWGVRRYQNSDGSLTDEGRKRYLKEGSEERSKVDKAAANHAYAEYKLDEAVERYMSGQQSQRFKELRVDKRLSNVSDRHLYDYYMDDLYDEDKAREHVLATNKRLASEYKKAQSEYDIAMRQMYDSVKDKTLDKIKTNKKEKDAFKRFVDLYENELVIDSYKKRYGNDWKKKYNEIFR